MKKTNQQENQFAYEKKWADTLINYLNATKNTDYKTKKPDLKKYPDWADIDVEAVSESGKFTSLYLQLVQDSRYCTPEDGCGTYSYVEKGIEKYPIVFDSDNIALAILQKEQKYTRQKKIFSNITLVIQGT